MLLYEVAVRNSEIEEEGEEVCVIMATCSHERAIRRPIGKIHEPGACVLLRHCFFSDSHSSLSADALTHCLCLPFQKV